MECSNIDFIGPFPDRGHILVIVDIFTRWGELYHSMHLFSYDQMMVLISSQMEFEIINSLSVLSHCLTLAYLKEENAIVERYNREINLHLSALTFYNLSSTGYRKSLPLVQRILISNNSDRSKISASQMHFGNMLNLDKGIFTPISVSLKRQFCSLILY